VTASRGGPRLKRVDAVAKVTGAAKYLADLPAESALEGVFVLAAIPAGQVRSFDTTAARAMDGLRPAQREVLRLSVAQGLTHEEIASQTGMPLGTVKAHARRGLLSIRSLLLGEGPGEVSAEEDVP